jgi:hypothetical protein
MAKAEYRRSDVDALRPSTPIGEEDHAPAFFVVPTSRESPTPDALDAARLVAEIARLYRELIALPCQDRPDNAGKNGQGRTWRGSLAYQALETQIRHLAARHWQITGGHTITHRPKSTVAPSTAGIPRRFVVRSGRPAQNIRL